jgi:hypothetical protein
LCFTRQVLCCAVLCHLSHTFSPFLPWLFLR